ncbi:MAG TPA: hypothetical protein VN577_20045 [Terriglobales bacterium]|nr:hypothetical protein [Terriglobales bacterium]
MKKSRPRTGEKREVRQPLKIDKLPLEVHERIQKLRAKGKTWLEIEEMSKGFVPWDKLPTATLELFPDLHLPHSNLQRWYDLRIEQVSHELAAEAERARQFSKAIAKIADVEQLGDAAVNALSDVVFSVMKAQTRDKYAKAVESLGYLAAKMTDAKSKRVRAEAESKRIAILEREIAEKKNAADKATEAMAKKSAKGKAITQDDINNIRQRVFGLPPVQKSA